MLLKGIVEDIIFRNEGNGYTVLTIDAGGVPETVVGCFPVLAEGETAAFEGDYKETPKYGRQFSAVSVACAAPESLAGITSFLGSGLLAGVGEVTAANIVHTFGEESLEVIENDPDRLAMIRGISIKRARDIHDAYAAVSGMRAAVIFLQNLGFGSGTAVKIYKEYGVQTESKLRVNPYRLVEEVDGIGFLTADRVAIKLGVQENSQFRRRAGLIHLLKTASDTNGHTYLPVAELAEGLRELLHQDVSEEEVEDLALTLTLSGTAQLLTVEGGEKIVMLAKHYRVEKGVAEKLIRLIDAADKGGIEADRAIERYEEENGVRFHEMQKDAIRTALSAGVGVITGGPGTGKTTIIKCVLNILKQNGHTVKLLAPTGRAAKRMLEATGYPASTIHRALQSEGEGGRFSKNESNPIEATAVIVDEVSMVDAYLMYALVKALRPGTRLLLVGDRDQLPSVGAGNVLADILASGVVPTVSLTQIYRQALTSHIVTNAHLINEGKMPVLGNGSETDFFFLTRRGSDEIAHAVVEMISERLPKYLGIDPLRIQVLSPIKAGAAGVINLNKMIQAVLNPPRPDKPELEHGEQLYRAGDKVMHVVNDYDIEWTRDGRTGVEKGSGVFNGDIGTVDIIYAGHETDVVYEDGKRVRYTAENLDEIMLSYAITVHKSQGCEFDAVVMPILGGSPTMLTKNLLYTGITRAKRLVALVGEKYHLERMVQNDYTRRRYSRLQEMLIAGQRGLLALGGQSDGSALGGDTGRSETGRANVSAKPKVE